MVDVNAGPDPAVRCAAEMPSLGGQLVLGSQTWPGLGTGWASALSARAPASSPSASTRTDDVAVSWSRDATHGVGTLVAAGRRSSGAARSRALLRFRGVDVGWQREREVDRAVCAWSSRGDRAPSRVELLGGRGEYALRGGLGGGREPAGLVGEWRSEDGLRSWRVRGGVRAERATRAGASLEVETSGAGERRESRAVLGASASRAGVAARLDVRASSRGSTRVRSEVALPCARGALHVGGEVSAAGVDAVEIRLEAKAGRVRLYVPSTGPPRAAVAFGERRVAVGCARGVIAWERGRATSLELEWSPGDGR